MYSTRCQCGQQILVDATSAGSTLPCECGLQVRIPPLSQLRKSAGQSEFPQNTLQRIAAQIADGELPQCEICPHSGRPANETIWMRVQCETQWVRGGENDNSAWYVLFAVLFGWLGMILLRSKANESEGEEMGRDTFIEVPVMISSDARREILRINSQAKLKAMLCKTPMYEELLKEFPDARIYLLESS